MNKLLKFIFGSEDAGENAMESTTPKVLSPQELLGRPLNDVEQKYAPRHLYVACGKEIPIPGPRAAIVGSRQASAQGLKDAAEIAAFLAKNGVVIVSGLAEGVDTSAHKAALNEGGSTIAVLGTSLDKFYPAKNAELQKIMMREQWVISQFPKGHPTEPKNFVLRNRTMALISDASIIVQASETSGSLHQGWEALRLGRPLFIWKSIMKDKSLKWPVKMVDYGAVVLEEPEQIMEALPSSERILQITI